MHYFFPQYTCTVPMNFSLNIFLGKMKDEHTCGRPLGLRFDNEGRLIVADSYLGLHRVDVKTGKCTKYIEAPILKQIIIFTVCSRNAFLFILHFREI